MGKLLVGVTELEQFISTIGACQIRVVGIHLILNLVTRLSGYLLLICLLYTIHLGGAWSTWVVMSATHTQRFLAYTVAPLIVLAAVFSCMRYVYFVLV